MWPPFALQVVMQPDSPARQKLAQLPQPALEALLDSDELQAASENTVIAAVTYWLEQLEGALDVTKDQKQRLAYKLRLFCATPWYLTHVLLDEGPWLNNILSSQQKLVLTAAAHNPAGFGKLQSKENWMVTAELFGRGNSVRVSWWEKKRPASSITEAELLVEISPAEVWSKQGNMITQYSPVYFYNGIMWSLRVRAWFKMEESGGLWVVPYVNHSSCAAPVALTAHLEVVGAAPEDTREKKVDQVVLWRDGTNCGESHLRLTGGCYCQAGPLHSP
jgi:hypothetical protein